MQGSLNGEALRDRSVASRLEFSYFTHNPISNLER